jgi:hypothetical protein
VQVPIWYRRRSAGTQTPRARRQAAALVSQTAHQSSENVEMVESTTFDRLPLYMYLTTR